jgi:hypothetical protein
MENADTMLTQSLIWERKTPPRWAAIWLYI